MSRSSGVKRTVAGKTEIGIPKGFGLPASVKQSTQGGEREREGGMVEGGWDDAQEVDRQVESKGM